MEQSNVELRQPSCAASYIAELVARGPMFFVDGADVEIHGLSVDRDVLPLVVNRKSNRSAAAWSPYRHYYSSTLEEFGRHRSGIARGLARALLSPAGAALRLLSFDKAVFVNHWLVNSNPGVQLSSTQIGELRKQLQSHYPDFAIVVPSVNPAIDASVCTALRENGFRFVRRRCVYVLNCNTKDYLLHGNTRADLRLLRRSAYEMIDAPDVLNAHADRMRDLYQSLYLRKYSRWNPRLSAEFFRLTLRTNALRYQALVRDGRVDAFVGFFLQEKLMTAAVMGYDQTIGREAGLYRAALALLIAEAGRRGVLLNLGGGVGQFKMLRGAVPVEEFDAVCDEHLPFSRRLPWRAVEIAARVGVLPP